MISALQGKAVFIRTVTYHYTGLLVGEAGGFAQLQDAAWIADSGRFADALLNGEFDEVEPYPGDCYVALGAICDISEWKHELPRKQK